MDENLNNYLKSAEEKMSHSLKHLESELTKLRAGRATPELVKDLKVNYYGQDMPLYQVANIAAADARTLIIQPWEKSMLDPIEKEILKANLGFTPINNGQVIRINIPELTEERRKQLAKQVKEEGEKAKIAIRNIRRDTISKVKKLTKEGVSEDAVRDLQDDIEDLTKKYVEKVDKVVQAKTKEIMSV